MASGCSWERKVRHSSFLVQYSIFNPFIPTEAKAQRRDLYVMASGCSWVRKVRHSSFLVQYSIFDPCSIFDIQPIHPDRSTSAAEGSFCDGFRVFMGKESSSFVIPCSVFAIRHSLFNIRYSLFPCSIFNIRPSSIFKIYVIHSISVN